jgi:hypothetical protein
MPCYFILRLSSDPKVTGLGDGSNQAIIDRSSYTYPEDYDEMLRYLGSNEYWSLIEEAKRKNFVLENVVCKPKSNLTNFISYAPNLINCPFLISNIVYQILSEFHIANHRSYSAKVKYNKHVHPYYLLHISPLDLDVIDFNRSIFQSEFDFPNENNYNFRSPEELEEFGRKNIGISGKNIYLDPNKILNIDMFCLRYSGIVVSEKVKIRLERERACSGAVFLPAFGDVPWPTVTI